MINFFLKIFPFRQNNSDKALTNILMYSDFQVSARGLQSKTSKLASPNVQKVQYAKLVKKNAVKILF